MPDTTLFMLFIGGNWNAADGFASTSYEPGSA